MWFNSGDNRLKYNWGLANMSFASIKNSYSACIYSWEWWMCVTQLTNAWLINGSLLQIQIYIDDNKKSGVNT